MLYGVIVVAAVPFAFCVGGRGAIRGTQVRRGLAGMTTSFLEVPGNMVAQTNKRGPAEGIPVGFVIVLGMIVPRTLVGVYEFVSAPFPAPAGYRPILRPEFPWDYF